MMRAQIQSSVTEARGEARPIALITARRVCALCAFGAALLAFGCEDEYASSNAASSTASTPATATKTPTTGATEDANANADAMNGTRPAQSVYGKAMERAERLKDDVAEYNKKLEDAADGKFDESTSPKKPSTKPAATPNSAPGSSPGSTSPR